MTPPIAGLGASFAGSAAVGAEARGRGVCFADGGGGAGAAGAEAEGAGAAVAASRIAAVLDGAGALEGAEAGSARAGTIEDVVGAAAFASSPALCFDGTKMAAVTRPSATATATAVSAVRRAPSRGALAERAAACGV